jgi:dipeptidyl-peptidase 4
MKKFLSIALLLLLQIIAFTQTNKLSLADAMLKARTTLAPENLKGLQFIYGTNDYVYLKKINENEVWVKGNVKTGETPLFNLSDAQGFFSNASTGKLATMPAVQFNKGKEWIATINGYKMAYNPKTKVKRMVQTKAYTEKTAYDEADNENIAYVESDNLFVKTPTETRQITTDGSKNIVYAQSVHRDEFGITKGIFWNTTGTALAFYRMDQTPVADYPILDWSTNPATVENIKYPMAGGTSHQVTVGIHHIATNKTIYLNTQKDDHYLTNICWSPDNKFIYIAEVNRAQNEMQLNQYDAHTGNFVKTIFEEKDTKYVEPLVPMQFLPNNTNQFLWQSNRDGFNHLYLYDVNTGMVVQQVTKGNFDILENKGFDAKAETLFYVATDSRGLTKKLYSYNFKTRVNTLRTSAPGVHLTQISTDGSTILDTYSNTLIPREVLLINNKTSKKLLTAANPLSNYETGTMDLISINNRYGDTLNSKTYYPPNYDNAKKYPAIVYWYGGPHAQMVTNSWNAGAGDYWFKYMATQGFIVIVPDVRGSDNRGKAFEQSMFREVGKVQMEDLEDILSAYKNFIDTNRLGLFGWSFGGFMTTNFILQHPNVFKAAVAGGPVMDWSLYEIMYTERYMDTPQENPDGYTATNLVKQVDKLKGKLLLIHGLQDPVVVQQHSVNFVRAAIDKSIQVDYMIYPGHEHNVLGKDRVHLYQKITDYFMLYLK